MRLNSIVGLCVLLLPLGLCAQEAAPASTPSPAATPATPDPPAQPGAETGKRIFGVLPNYKTVDTMTGAYQPISTRTKFTIAAKDSFDYPNLFVAGLVSGFSQLSGQNPEWGQGMQGYGKRYGAALADQVISNYLTEAILPSLLHQDPRYFRMGQGKDSRRILHALSWVVIGKTDNNRSTLNVSELLGSGASAAIGTLYYPAHERTASSVGTRIATQIGFDAGSSVLKEYWPDIQRRLFKKRH